MQEGSSTRFMENEEGQVAPAEAAAAGPSAPPKRGPGRPRKLLRPVSLPKAAEPLAAEPTGTGAAPGTAAATEHAVETASPVVVKRPRGRPPSKVRPAADAKQSGAGEELPPAGSGVAAAPGAQPKKRGRPPKVKTQQGPAAPAAAATPKKPGRPRKVAKQEQEEGPGSSSEEQEEEEEDGDTEEQQHDDADDDGDDEGDDDFDVKVAGKGEGAIWHPQLGSAKKRGRPAKAGSSAQHAAEPAAKKRGRPPGSGKAPAKHRPPNAKAEGQVPAPASVARAARGRSSAPKITYVAGSSSSDIKCSAAAGYGSALYVGLITDDPAGAGPEDEGAAYASQMKQVLEKLDAVLEEAGNSSGNLLMVRIFYAAQPGAWGAVADAWNSYIESVAKKPAVSILSSAFEGGSIVGLEAVAAATD